MTNEEHLNILKEGIKGWNKWRTDNPRCVPELTNSDFRARDLRGIDFKSANLQGVNFWGSDLRNADFRGANLSKADLGNTRLNRSKFGVYQAHLGSVSEQIYRTDLRWGNLTAADLESADISDTLLANANLSGASLIGADFSHSILDNTIFAEAKMGETLLVDNDLHLASGLDSVVHRSPSSIDTKSMLRSKGNISEVFLRGCGLSDWEIEAAKLYKPNLTNEELSDSLYRLHGLRSDQAVQISPLFISYSHEDSSFVDILERYLDRRGIRFWRDVHDATAGRLEKQVDRAIRLNPTVLLVLSANSVSSDWVQHEAQLAREVEIESGRDVLCPVTLDDSWKSCRWPRRLLKQITEYYILDFSRWKDADFFQLAFNRLIKGLHSFYG